MRDDTSSRLRHRPALEFSYAELTDAFNRCFEGYIVPVSVGAAELERRCRSETTDLAASRVYLDGDRVAGIVFVNRRGLRCRIGAIGLAAESRGAGVGTRMMREAIDEARSRGHEEMVLEVIEANIPAVDLYRKLGFETVRRLVGYRKTDARGEAEGLREIDPVDLSRVVAREGERNLPWMLAPETLAAYAPPARAYTLAGRAFALIGDSNREAVTLVAVVVPAEFRRRGWGRRTVRALFAAYPGREWSVMQIVPKDLAPGFFDRLGFERDDLTQLEMRIGLGGS